MLRRQSTSGEITDTVEIDTTGFGPKIEIANGSTLRLSPKVSPANDPDLAYEWKITVTSNGNETTFSKLSEEKDLERVITQAPSQKPYSLVFTVTNKRTGVQYMQRYNVYVISRMGDGVLVADTRDGATSDISLVRNKYVSGRLHRGYPIHPRFLLLYERTENGRRHAEAGLRPHRQYRPGILRDGDDGQNAGKPRRQHPRSHPEFRPDVHVPPEKEQKFQTLGTNFNSVFFVYEGDIYAYARQIDAITQTFSDPLNYVSPSQIANKKFGNEYLQVNADMGDVFFFDETKGAFYHMTPAAYPIAPLTAGTGGSVNFDPNALSGYTLIGSCRGEQVSRSPVHVRVHFILKDPQGAIDVLPVIKPV